MEEVGMRKGTVQIALASATIFALGTPAIAVPTQEKLELAREAKVELTDAIAKATSKVPGRAIESELKNKKGKLVWEVEIVGEDGKLNEVDLDAKTGEVIDSE